MKGNRAAYLKEWRAKNKEKRAAYLKEWRAKNKEKMAAYLKEWRARNKKAPRRTGRHEKSRESRDRSGQTA